MGDLEVALYSAKRTGEVAEFLMRLHNRSKTRLLHVESLGLASMLCDDLGNRYHSVKVDSGDTIYPKCRTERILQFEAPVEGSGSLELSVWVEAEEGDSGAVAFRVPMLEFQKAKDAP